MVEHHNEYTHFDTKILYFRFKMAAVTLICIVLVWPEVLEKGETEADEILHRDSPFHYLSNDV